NRNPIWEAEMGTERIEIGIEIRKVRLSLRDEGEGGKADSEAAALAGNAFDAEFSAHRVNQSFADREPEAGPFGAVALGISELEELVEDVREVFRSDTDTGIGDEEMEGSVSVAVGADADFTGIGEFYRV